MTKKLSSTNAVGIFFLVVHLIIIGIMILDSRCSSSCFVFGFQTTTTTTLSSSSSSSSLPLSLSQQRQIPTSSSRTTTTTRIRAIELENVDVKTITTTTTTTPTTSLATTAAAIPSTSLTSPSGIIDEGYPSINSSNHAATNNNKNKNIPKTMSEAVRVFFLSQPDYGPLMVVASIVSFAIARISTIATVPIDVNDVVVFGLSILFWSIQEHWIHDRLLHSKFNWIGKQIHIEHHTKPYYHISIDSAPLLLGWMLCAHIIFKLIFSSSYQLALSATIGYALAGLFYEWAHYLVHTKIKFSNGSFWKLVKDNHVRHHLVNSNYWFSFSLPWIDDLFGTNPPVRNVPKMTMQQQQQQQP